jgi:hypothetical protein
MEETHMGIAAYNRGSYAIRQQFEMERISRERILISIGPAIVPEKAAADPLPEGRLRSTFFPETEASGTALYLDYENRWYVICTKFEILKRTRNLNKAIRIFENLEMFGLCALERKY